MCTNYLDISKPQKMLRCVDSAFFLKYVPARKFLEITTEKHENDVQWNKVHLQSYREFSSIDLHMWNNQNVVETRILALFN